jgi:hypothetical protein
MLSTTYVVRMAEALRYIKRIDDTISIRHSVFNRITTWLHRKCL